MTTAYSHSTRQMFLTCPRKFYLSKTLRLEPDREHGRGRTMGKAFADALEIAAEAPDPADAVVRAVNLIEQRYAKYVLDARAGGKATDVDRLLLEEVQLRVLVSEYLRRYHGRLTAEAYAAGALTISTEREIEFDDPILGPGRLDAIVEYGAKRIGLEDKLLTPGFWREASERQLRVNAQVTAYFCAMRAAGTPLDELRYRVTFKPSIKPNSRKGESLAEYEIRLRDRVVNETGYAFREYVLFRTDAEMDAFERRVESVSRAMARAKRDLPKYGEAAAYPANFGESCTLFGECDFLELCIHGPGATGYRVKAIRPKLTARQATTLRTLGDSFTALTSVPDLSKQSGLTDQQARSDLRRLEQLGLATKTTFGSRVAFAVTTAGEAWLA